MSGPDPSTTTPEQNTAPPLAAAHAGPEWPTNQAGSELLYRVLALLQAGEPHYPRLEQVAQQLHLSPRTFKRRLQSLGSGYQLLLDQVRMERARQLLRESSQPVDIIASSLGYSDASNFSRAFRRWQGMTPALYRRRERDHNEK